MGCEAITSTGKACAKQVKPPTDYCGLHGNALRRHEMAHDGQIHLQHRDIWRGDRRKNS